ncbi:uncharacterized protein LOC109595210 isoform X2 [Aethina tumida]|uniref:uncharacterized protein LOC109595210 isoform X2 n=1 Tax=Aethina tumida TaxID=116153 RepID=UPI0021488148|nr:uncharacterized protein LOC109595210 isoform X2 [Aethina tumida]
MRILIFLSVIISIQSSLPNKETNPDLLARAKRNFQRRQRRFVLEQGVSPDLQSFINSFQSIKRSKRTDFDKSHMYVIKDGEVVPLADVHVPDISSLTSNSDSQDKETTKISQVPIAPAAIAAVENVQNFPPHENISNASKPCPGTSDLISNNSVNNSTNGTTNGALGKMAQDFTVLPLVVPLGDDSGHMGNAKDDLIIDRILEDVEGLAQMKHSKSSKFSGIDGSACNATGSWISTAGGMELTIPLTEGNETKKVELRKTISPLSSPGFLLEGGWSLSAQLPFQHSSIVLLLGTRKEGKKIATFIGECKVCGGSEMISGDWMIGRASSDCKDQKAAHSMLSDVLRKDNVQQLHESHMKELGKTNPSI